MAKEELKQEAEDYAKREMVILEGGITMSNDEKKKEEQVPKKEITFCTWTNRGSKTFPSLFTVGCNGQNVNVVKMMKKKGQFIDKCPFCGLTVSWQGRKNDL